MNITKQRSHSHYHDAMLPNSFYEGDDLKRDANHLSHSSSKKNKEQHFLIQQENNFARHNYDDYKPNGSEVTKRHNRIIGSSNDLTMLGKNNHHPLLPSHHVIPGTQNIYQKPFLQRKTTVKIEPRVYILLFHTIFGSENNSNVPINKQNFLISYIFINLN